MSYYDFDNHFWGAKEVCGQCEESEEDKQTSFASRIVGTIFSAFKAEEEEEENNNTKTIVKVEKGGVHLSGEPQQQL